MKNRKYLSLLIPILIVGFIVRTFLAYLQPTWLDEKYSLLFATQFSSTQLLTHFSNDVHPGLYYLILKIVLSFTTNIFFIRIITGVIPQMVGIFILAKANQDHKSNSTSLLLTTLLVTNPFFIHLSWQLRSYSLIFLLVSVVYFFLTKLEKKYEKKHLIFLLLILLLGNMLHYGMYIFSFFVGMYLLYIWPKKSLKIKAILLLSWSLIFVLQFLFQNNFQSIDQYKSVFNDINWISKPTLQNIHHVYSVSLGFTTDNQVYFFNQVPSFIIFLRYVFLVWLCIFIKNNVQKEKAFVVILIAFPFLSIIAVSLILPFLSERWLINQFIPNISIFMPRIHLPFIIFFWVIISKILIRKWTEISNQLKVIIALTFVGTIFYWTYVIQQNYMQTSTPFIEQRENVKKIVQQSALEKKQLYIWPHWMFLEIITENSLEETNVVQQLQQPSKEFEKRISQESSFSCSNFEEAEFYVYTPKFGTQSLLQEKIISKLNECCDPKERTGSFDQWECHPQ